MYHIPNIVHVAKNLRLDKQGTGIKENTTVLLKKFSNKITPGDNLLYLQINA